MRKLMALEKRRKLPKRSGKTFKLYTYKCAYTPTLLSPPRVITIRKYSDFANFSDLKVDTTWRGYIRQVSTIPAATVYHMLYVDMGQEW
jgi:hypothetical protein